MWRTRKLWRGLAALAGAGLLLQTSGCALDTEALAYQVLTAIIEAVITQMTTAATTV